MARRERFPTLVAAFTLLIVASSPLRAQIAEPCGGRRHGDRGRHRLGPAHRRGHARAEAPNEGHRAIRRRGVRVTGAALKGQDVRLECDWQRTDRCGRTLAYLYLADGTFVNAEIVRQGFGFAYTKYPFKHLEEFHANEREARAATRGLWAQEP